MIAIIFFVQMTLLYSPNCSCEPPTPLDSVQYNSYDFILKGKVVNVVKDLFEQRVSIEVDKIYKGERKRSVVLIKTAASESECGIYFKKGQTWLVYAYGTRELMTNLCNRTIQLSSGGSSSVADGEADLKYLEAILRSNGS